MAVYHLDSCSLNEHVLSSRYTRTDQAGKEAMADFGMDEDDTSEADTPL